jgi:hypothetical protein
MKATSIQIGRSYEIAFGKNSTKVKVKNFDPKNGSLICETETGKTIPIKDPKRFLKEIKPKEPKKTKDVTESKQKTVTGSVKERKKEIVPEKKPVSVSSKPTQKPVTNPDMAQRLLGTMREAVTRANVAKRAFEFGFCSKKDVEQAEKEAETARVDVRTAGISERKSGHTIGVMSGLDAAYKVLQDEGHPMRAKEILQLALQRGYCELRGATPAATISAAMDTEMKRKGKESRFAKAGKGLYNVVEN